MSEPRERGQGWTLLSGHGHVLVEIARNPGARMRDLSAIVDLTERTVQAIVADLVAAGYVTRTRNGRRNLYTINRDSLFRHNAQYGQKVGPFLDLLTATGFADGREPALRSGMQAGPGNIRANVTGTDVADSEPAPRALDRREPAPRALDRR